MSSELIEKAYEKLFPITNEIVLDRALLQFLDQGGKAILFGEYSDEYAIGRMRSQRIVEETHEAWEQILSGLRQRNGPLLFACDMDIAAVNRLHHIVGDLPSREAAMSMTAETLTKVIEPLAGKVRELGMNMVLSPTADCVAPNNPWLGSRTVGDDVETVSRVVRAFVKGTQQAGLQTALKHFPGNDQITGVPSIETARVPLSIDDLILKAAPFRAGIEAGADAIALSSAIIEAAKPPVSASLSADIIQRLRSEFAFSGLVIALDLDHVSAQGKNTIEDTCVASLIAGADLLLLSPVSRPHIPTIVQAIVEAVETGKLPYERLNAATTALMRAVR